MIRLNKIGQLALIAFSVFFVSCGLAAAQDTPPLAKTKAVSHKTAPAPPLELEPKAIEILKTTSSKLAGAHTLSFTAVETFESLSRQGAPLVYGNKFETVLQRPNKLRVLLEGDGSTSEFYYDGKIVVKGTLESLMVLQWPHSHGCVLYLLAMLDANAERVAP
jgi:hypothetical protein